MNFKGVKGATRQRFERLVGVGGLIGCRQGG
jgi:hypothetical protein